ncbi:MAG TPA: SAM-dependent methyltransferase, partial [Pseudonocardiaceae bacterium]|nr:SAM-dependent methyltransferase [Pseudonocardiaceae bacterium]
MNAADQEPAIPPGVDLEHPSVARVYDFYLGGTANWAIDREFGKKVLARFPLLRPIAKANRLFLHRAVRHLVRQGVRQFVDIGSGVPTMGNTHQIADELAPDCRVVYIDNEPVAVAHSQMLLDQNGDPERHAAINADLREPDELWQRVRDTDVLDLTQPVALLLVAVLHV